jgi:hypothetical protein
MVFTPLNLPQATLKLVRSASNIRVKCIIRMKWVVLTPEEWVRQHVLNYMVFHAGYPKGQLAVEVGLCYNNKKKRCDILVYNTFGKPFLIVECKAPQIVLTKETLFQIATYDYTLNSSFLVVTNGLTHFTLEKKPMESKLNVVEGIRLWEAV